MIQHINNVFLFALSVHNGFILSDMNLKSDMVLIFRENFGKFWNMIENENKIIFINSVFENLQINNQEIIDQTFVLLNKILIYADNVDFICHVKNFYEVNDQLAKTIIKGNETSLKYGGKNELSNFKCNFLLFWLGLTTERKNKIIELSNDFLSLLNSNELDIIYKKKSTYSGISTDYFCHSNKNVMSIRHEKELVNMIDNIENNKNNDIIINTIILDFCYLNSLNKFDYSQKILQNIPNQIKNLKIINGKLNSIDWLHNNIEVLDCRGNYIKELNNLPNSIKILLCGNNQLKKIDNLPTNLEYLDCHTNMIVQLHNLPKSLKYLNCNHNNIISIDNLPNNLIEINCSYNSIYKYTKLPENLIILSIGYNHLKDLGILPYGLKKLNIQMNYIEYIYSINSNIEKIYIGDRYDGNSMYPSYFQKKFIKLK